MKTWSLDHQSVLVDPGHNGRSDMACRSPACGSLPTEGWRRLLACSLTCMKERFGLDLHRRPWIRPKDLC
jgi:hypothetical protein